MALRISASWVTRVPSAPLRRPERQRDQLECVHARVILDWAWSGCSTRAKRQLTEPAFRRRGAPAGSDATALPGRASRPGAPAGRGVGAARGDRDRGAALGDPVRAAGLREDDPGQDHRHRVPRGVRGVLRGERGAGRGPRRDRAGTGAPQGRGRADDLLPRRDPSLQQGPAGRAAARGRGGAGDADRGDDREPLFRGQFGAALARADLRAACVGAQATFEPCWAGRSRIPNGEYPSLPRSTPRRWSCSPRARAATRGWRSPRSSARRRPRGPGAIRSTSAPPRTRSSARRSAMTARAIATTTTSRRGSRPPGRPTPTHRSTTWR